MKTMKRWIGIGLVMLCAATQAGVVIVLNPLGGDADIPVGALNDILQSELSQSEEITLVDRQQLRRILEELKLGQQGMIPPESARKLGRMAGARYFVSGYVREAGEQTMGTIKVVDVETTLIKTGYVMMADGGDVVAAGKNLAQQAQTRVLAFEKELDAQVAEQPETAKAIPEDWKRPVVMLHVPEEHLPARVTFDPAGETEIMKRLISAGFTVIDAEQVNLAKENATGGPPNAGFIMIHAEQVSLPNRGDRQQEKTFASYAKSAGADVAILGEAVAEFGARLGDLEGCRARIELKAMDTRTEQVLWVDSAEAGATDLAEQIAGKKAIQKAANDLADTFLYELLEKWNEDRP